jgi:N-acetyl-anhydromuramyl-L-alanine amidase AmpD
MPAPALAAPLAAPPVAPPDYYPQIQWIGASPSNYDVGRVEPITLIVIHETDGSFTSAMNWFRNPWSEVSAHYVIRAWDGGIMQFVAESDTAWHARPWNKGSIGIEHEFYPRMGIWHTDAQYRSSAALVCAITRRYGIPADRDHIVGHRELPGATHGDPGPSWNWSYFMSLVNACSGPRAQLAARGGPRTRQDDARVPAAALELGASGDEVALLQWDLAYLGFMPVEDVRTGVGTFGPLTLSALTDFQSMNELEPTGIYGESAAAALVSALVSEQSGLPLGELDPGAESDGVAAVQAALQMIGYMDLVTGYYGPITTDAVTRFQRDNGIDATGSYGPVTRMALAALTR